MNAPIISFFNILKRYFLLYGNDFDTFFGIFFCILHDLHYLCTKM